MHIRFCVGVDPLLFPQPFLFSFLEGEGRVWEPDHTASDSFVCYSIVQLTGSHLVGTAFTAVCM